MAPWKTHGFRFEPSRECYTRIVGVGADEAFVEVARLIIGTFMHVWGAAPADHFSVDLQISLPAAHLATPWARLQ